MPLFTLRPSAPPRLKVNPRKPVSQLETQNREPSTGNREPLLCFSRLAKRVAFPRTNSAE
jgi:hypothetical protein